jgi:hypothetical protein
MRSVEATLSPSEVQDARNWAKQWKPMPVQSSNDSLARDVSKLGRAASSQESRPEAGQKYAGWYGYGYSVGNLMNEAGALFSKKPKEKDLWDYLARHDSLGPNARGRMFSARMKDEDVEACKQGYVDSISGHKAMYPPRDNPPPLL